LLLIVPVVNPERHLGTWAFVEISYLPSGILPEEGELTIMQLTTLIQLGDSSLILILG